VLSIEVHDWFFLDPSTRCVCVDTENENEVVSKKIDNGMYSKP